MRYHRTYRHNDAYYKRYENVVYRVPYNKFVATIGKDNPWIHLAYWIFVTMVTIVVQDEHATLIFLCHSVNPYFV